MVKAVGLSQIDAQRIAGACALPCALIIIIDRRRCLISLGRTAGRHRLSSSDVFLFMVALCAIHFQLIQMDRSPWRRILQDGDPDITRRHVFRGKGDALTGRKRLIPLGVDRRKRDIVQARADVIFIIAFIAEIAPRSTVRYCPVLPPSQ